MERASPSAGNNLFASKIFIHPSQNQSCKKTPAQEGYQRFRRTSNKTEFGLGHPFLRALDVKGTPRGMPLANRRNGRLGDVVAEAGENHVVGGLGSAVGCRRRAERTARQTSPSIT